MYKRDKVVKSGSYIRSKFEAGQKKKKAGNSSRGNPISKVADSIKGALSSLGRKKDSSATRKIEGPKTKRLSSPTAQQAANKLIKTGQGTVKKTTPNRPVNSNAKDVKYTAKQREKLAKLDRLSPGLAKRERARLDSLLKRAAK